MKVIMILILLIVCSITLATDLPFEVPPLPKRRGSVINVKNESQLQNATRQIRDRVVIMIHPGTYKLTNTINIWTKAKDVALIGATGNPDDVIIVGKGMKNEDRGNVENGIQIGPEIDGILIAHLTIKDVYYHSITCQPGAKRPHIYNCRLIDAGQQFIKGNKNDTKGVDSGKVEYNVIEYTDACRGTYTNGLSIHRARGWQIRNNLFVKVRASKGLAGPAVLMWSNSSDTLCENNIFIDCQIGIAYGWSDRDKDHEGGIIRNNIFYRSKKQHGDVGIALWSSPKTEIYHNTVFLNGTYSNAIEYRFQGTVEAVIKNNLCDARVQERNGANADTENNITDAKENWLTDPEKGDFRLRFSKKTIAAAVNKVKPMKEVQTDYEGDKRPAGPLSDIGADEITPQQLKRKPKDLLKPAKPAEDIPEKDPWARPEEEEDEDEEVEVF